MTATGTALALSTITDDQVQETVRAIVAERPNYVYSCPEYMPVDDSDLGCFYVHADEDGNAVAPGCLIGTALNRLGMPLTELAEFEGYPAHTVTEKILPNVSKGMRRTLLLMQNYQDSSATWGEAYVKATGEHIADNNALSEELI